MSATVAPAVIALAVAATSAPVATVPVPSTTSFGAGAGRDRLETCAHVCLDNFLRGKNITAGKNEFWKMQISHPSVSRARLIVVEGKKWHAARRTVLPVLYLDHNMYFERPHFRSAPFFGFEPWSSQEKKGRCPARPRPLKFPPYRYPRSVKKKALPGRQGGRGDMNL